MSTGSKIYDNEATASGNDYTAVAGCTTTLLPAADMNLPGRDNWFEDKAGARYITSESPVVYPVVGGDTSALDLTLGIVHVVTYKDGLEGVAFADDVHENLPHNSVTPDYTDGTPTHEGHKMCIRDRHEFNPMLGHRGVRLAVTFPEIAVMQTRAVMEAAIEVIEETGYDIVPEIMIPLVGDQKELKYVKDFVVETAEKVMEEKGKKIDYKVGTMIEVPRAAVAVSYTHLRRQL